MIGEIKKQLQVYGLREWDINWGKKNGERQALFNNHFSCETFYQLRNIKAEINLLPTTTRRQLFSGAWQKPKNQLGSVIEMTNLMENSHTTH